MLDQIGEITEKGFRMIKGMSSMQKAACVGLGLGILGVAFILCSSDDEDVIPAENVDISDPADTPEEPEVVEAEVTEAEASEK